MSTIETLLKEAEKDARYWAKHAEGLKTRAETTFVERVQIFKDLIPDLEDVEDVKVGVSVHCYPIRVEIPFNKRILNQVMKRFIKLGWEFKKLEVNEKWFSIQTEYKYREGSTGQLLGQYIYIKSGYATEEAEETCRAVKIGSKMVEEAVYELVCDEGAEEDF